LETFFTNFESIVKNVASFVSSPLSLPPEKRSGYGENEERDTDFSTGDASTIQSPIT
jgi:hypothetical protein